MQTRNQRGFSLWLIVLGAILFVLIVTRLFQPPISGEPYTYANLLDDLANRRIQHVLITPDRDVANVGEAIVTLEGDVRHTVQIPNRDMFTSLVMESFETYGMPAFDTMAAPRPSIFIQLLPILLISVVFIVVLFFVMGQAQGGGGRAMNFGKSRAKMNLQGGKGVKFSEVAGLEEEKEEMTEIVDFLKDPTKYINMGARIPRGILLVGPPGTGKTYLARAVAGEADVPFYSISGSDFVEMFVGVGASRVRDLFEQAKRNPASIVFIDEIDAVGRKRGAGLGGGHDEREQTLNQLLVEMDGFGENEGVIILAATNRPDILDPALLRPGRFDRRIVVNPPDVKGREEVLRVHAAKKQVSPEVSLKTVAQTTAGFTPADLENLMNESALLAARENKLAIDMESIRKAFIKMGIGTEKKSRVITEKDRRITAYHEAGHAICHELLPDMDSTYIISVIPTGRAGGYVMPLPREDRNTMSKRYMEQQIISLLGGRAAEAIVLKDITTGASNDIERATAIARSMVTKFGMSEALGPIQFGNDNDEVFIGRDLATTRNYGEGVAAQIDSEIKRIVEAAYNEAVRLLEQHADVMHKIVELLMEKERVPGEQIRALFPVGTLEDKEHQKGFLVGGSFA